MGELYKDNQLYLRHILEAIEKVEEFIKSVDPKHFIQNVLLIDAVSFELAVIGEAAGHLSEELREKYAHVPWGKIIGTRNELIHGYFNRDLTIIWQTCQEDLPELKKEVLEILGE